MFILLYITILYNCFSDFQTLKIVWFHLFDHDAIVFEFWRLGGCEKSIGCSQLIPLKHAQIAVCKPSKHKWIWSTSVILVMWVRMDLSPRESKKIDLLSCFSSKHGQHVSAGEVQFENHRIRRIRSGFVSRIASTFSAKRTPRRQERAEVNTIHINTAISACRREKSWEVPLTFLHQTLGSPEAKRLPNRSWCFCWVLFHSSKLMMYLDDVSIKVKFNPVFFGS